MMETVVENTLSVETIHGYRTINLLVGDICDAQDKLIVASSHANRRRPVTGQVITGLRAKYGLDFADHVPIILTQGVAGTYRVASAAQMAGRDVFLLRIYSARTIQQQGMDPQDVYREGIWSLFGSLAALEMDGKGYESMALPLLGGRRGFSIDQAIRTILEFAVQWLENSSHMRTINLYVLDSQDAIQWTAAMNEALGRRPTDKAENPVYQALCDEILQLISTSRTFTEPEAKDLLNPILQTLKNDAVCIEILATFGRKVAEFVVNSLCVQHGIALKWGLADNIKALRAAKVVAPWIITHFETLRAHGNAAVHALEKNGFVPPTLEDEDLLSVLISLLRVLLFWRWLEEKHTQPSPAT